MNILEGLNKRQKEAVECIHGPLLLVAGAGSGKTKALTHRIAYMIEQGISPWQILAVTFTNKAAKEMSERVEKLITQKVGIEPQKKSDMPAMGTFHSICAKILRTEIEALGYERDFVIYDTQDQESAMKQVLKRLDIDPKKWTPKSLLGQISNCKNQLQGPRIVKNTAENAYQDQLAEIYHEYQSFLQKNNALDFDDLIMLTVRLFEEFNDILEKYQRRWQYISVDEYQDTNHAQYKLIRLLSAQHGNLCVIGDSDQSIYAFRGAALENFLSFEQEFPAAKVIRLEQNYRSTKNIIAAADQVIANNVSRVAKQMFTENEEGEKIKVAELRTEQEEGEFVAKEIMKNAKTRGIRFSKNVVLYRTNAQSRVIEEALLKAQIPYKIIGGLKFYSRKEVKDILAYLRIINNPQDTVSLLRIINVPARKIGASSLNKVQNFATLRNLSLLEVIAHIEMVENLTPAARNAFSHFYTLYQTLKQEALKQPLSEFLDTLVSETGYKQLLSDGSVENMSRLENLEELKSVAARYDIYDELALQFFLEEVSLVQDSDQIEEDQDAVLLMTVHSAKGLEFDTVFVVGAEEDIFPHSRSRNNSAELEEERRLMYVAMTRAERQLYLSHAQKRMIFGQVSYNLPSRFLSEISEDFVELQGLAKQHSSSAYFEGSQQQQSFTSSADVDFSYSQDRDDDSQYSYDEDSQMEYEMLNYQEGMQVEHPAFGVGTIISIHGMVLTISFGPGNVKKIAANIAPLKPVEC